MTVIYMRGGTMEENRANTEVKDSDAKEVKEDAATAADGGLGEGGSSPEAETTPESEDVGTKDTSTEGNKSMEGGEVEQGNTPAEGEGTAQGNTPAEGDATSEGEGNSEGDIPAEGENKDESKASDTARKIKIGIVAAGAVFILLAAIYAASLMGGKNAAIDKEEADVVSVVPTEPAEKVTYAPITKEVVEEETEPESLLDIAQGNARYERCVYADGGVVIVSDKELYGAIDYEGKEIVPVKYADLEQYPTKEGRFVLSNSKTESVTKEQEGTTYSYEEVTTTYTLFDNTGKKLYEGNDEVLVSENVYMLAKEDDSDSRNNRIEYFKLDNPGKAFLVLYVNDQFSLNGFKDGKTAVMGFTAVPTEDQDTNPTNLFCGIMDEKGKVTWFAKAPGMDEFNEEVALWKEENKVVKQTAKKPRKEKLYDEEGNEIPEEELEDDEEAEDEETEDDMTNEEATGDEETLSEDDIYEGLDLTLGPVYHMNEILNAPNGGYFVYKDLFDVEDSYSWYTDKGVWYADLDTSFMKADAKAGFVLGNFNNGAVEAKSYLYNGEDYYNYGRYMVLTVGDKDVLIDITKGQGMTDENLNNNIVVCVHDEINLSSESYWMYRDGNTYGYLDAKGKEVKETYEAATDFVDGYALVMKKGNAYIIDDSFKELEDLGKVKDVSKAGDLFILTVDTGDRKLILKSVREDPTGKKDEKADVSAAASPDAKATPASDAKTTPTSDAKTTPTADAKVTQKAGAKATPTAAPKKK